MARTSTKKTVKSPSEFDIITSKLDMMSGRQLLFEKFVRENVRPDIMEKLDLLLSANSQNKEVVREQWVPQKGDYVRTINPPLIGRVVYAKVDGFNSFRIAHASGEGHWPAEWMFAATPEEISHHKEQIQWGSITELQEGDACECTPEQQKELEGLARSGGMAVLNDEPEYANQSAPNIRWDRWCRRGPFLIHTAPPDKCELNEGPNWLPFPEFKRRLEGTIAKKKAEEQARPLEFGDRAAHGAWDDLRVSVPWPDSNDRYELVRKQADGEIKFFDLRRSEFTVLIP